MAASVFVPAYADVARGVEAFKAGNYRQAQEQFKPEARKGDPEASYWLGVMFENGAGTKKDIDTALTWYRKSAEAGQVKAMLKLGELYMQGTDVLHDFDEARKWLEPAAREGDVDAMRDMGTLYAHGWGVKQNAIRAYIWFDYAASRGDPRSETLRDDLVKTMSEQDIAEAQRLADKEAPEVFKEVDKSAH
jgi:TPR repeat protein